MLVDSILSTALSEGAEEPASARITLQRYLAETLMIEAEAPPNQRSVLIAPARRWNPTPALAADLLTDTGRVPWLGSTTIATAPLTDSQIKQAAIGSGIGNSASMMAQYYIQRAEQYQPVIEMPTGVNVEIVFLEGFKIATKGQQQ